MVCAKPSPAPDAIVIASGSYGQLRRKICSSMGGMVGPSYELTNALCVPSLPRNGRMSGSSGKVRRALGQVDNRSVRRGGQGFGQQVAGIVAMRARLPQYECSGAPIWSAVCRTWRGHGRHWRRWPDWCVAVGRDRVRWACAGLPASMPEEVSEVTDSTMRCGVAVASVVRMSEG